MALFLSKATKNELEQLHNYAQKNNLFLEMRDKFGILLAVSTGLISLIHERDKNGKPLYRVETKKVLNYDHLIEIVQYDVQLSIYKKKEFLFKNPKTQDFFNKQENYWEKKVNDFQKNESLGNDVIVNRINKLK